MLNKLSLPYRLWYRRPFPSLLPHKCVSKSMSKYLLRLETPSNAFNNYPKLRFVRNFADSPCFPNKAAFEEVCNETLDSLTDTFEELVEGADHLERADVNCSDGVLTVQFGEPYGTYVINRQSPNQQIWLSSPTSGPKRYDYIKGVWVYRHDGVSLNELLSQEISIIVKKSVKFL